MTMFKIEVEDDRGLWTDVRGDDGKVLTFTSEDAARGALAERFPVLVQMEKYAGGKRTRHRLAVVGGGRRSYGLRRRRFGSGGDRLRSRRSGLRVRANPNAQLFIRIFDDEDD